MSDVELTPEQEERLTVAMFYGGLSTHRLIDILLTFMVSDKEQEEEWALNSLRAFGEIKRRYKDNPEIINSEKKLLDLLDKVFDFYFANYEKANSK